MELKVEQRDRTTSVIRVSGDLDVQTAGTLYDAFAEASKDQSVEEIVVDFSDVSSLESAGIAVVALFSEEMKKRGGRVRVANLSDSHRKALDMMPAAFDEAGEEGDQAGLFERIGERGYEAFDEVAYLVELVYDSIATFMKMVIRRMSAPKGSIIEQAVVIGVDAILIISLLSFLLGLIIAFQSAYQLQQFGANIYVANLVGIAMVREFGPMMTAIILAGRSGSAIAAELGTMTVQEEIDALKTMGIDPIRFLVVPRIVALTFVQPALTLIAMFVGILGGFIIGTSLLDLSAGSYFDQTVHAVGLGDFGNGLSKSVVFAWIIAVTGCYSGLRIQGGASSVGKATTQSVVTSIFLIIVADSVFATITTIMEFG